MIDHITRIPSYAYESYASQGPLGRVFILTFMGGTLLYGLFQKKVFPHNVARLVSKILFIPTLPLTLLMRWNNLSTMIDDTVILGTAPVGFLGHVERMHKQGVKGVVNMCTEYAGPQDYYARYNIKQLRLPTVDHFEPSLSSMEEAVKFINIFKEKGEKVYIHCKAGHGRAAAVTLAWMLSQNPERSGKDINALLVQRRKVRPTLYLQPNLNKFKALVDAKASPKLSSQDKA